MNIFGSFSNQSLEVDCALEKQSAIRTLWKIQQEARELINRGNQAECLTDSDAQAWVNEINSSRQIIQDSFLLPLQADLVRDKISIAISEFTKKVDEYTSPVLLSERSMDVESRARNIAQKFIAQFDVLAQQQHIDGKTREYLRSEVEMYFNSLKRNISDRSMRPGVKMQLLHELVDDFYEEVQKIYSDESLSKKRI
jgi:hypothetical protein